MKNTAIKAILILISAMCFAVFTACGVSTDSSMETNYAENVNKKAVKAFKEAKLIKVGEHTYYPDYLFEPDDRDKKFKDYILSVLEKCDKDLHDDIFVYIIMEAETKNEFRFSAKVIMDGVILEEGEMLNWHSPETGYVWDYDYSKFRRCDFTKSDLVLTEEACTTVYEDAKANSEKLYNDNKIYGTYLLKADGQGNLYYEFTVNDCSLVTIDAKSGSIIKAHYWNGDYTYDK